MKIKIAARNSLLSKVQVNIVEAKLHDMGIETEFIGVKTKADYFISEPLYRLGQGVFEKEVNEYVINGEADIAVHSMKDLTTELDNRLCILATIKRDSPYDALVGSKDIYKIESKSVVGTSSIRRKNFITFLRNDLEVKDLRGNIDTRIRKLQNKEYDAIIVAEAAIKRLKLDVQYQQLNPIDFTPEINQGIIAIVGKKSRKELSTIRELDDKNTRDEATAERNASRIVGGGCHSPIGIFFKKEDNSLFGIASFSNGKRKITVEISSNKEPNIVGIELGKKLLEEMKNEGITI
ncbi:hydroxymethylbilane synthase [Acidianus brierleyi]|uniref:Hydroxymethylbilane synthase n=1 Tax=Acidianus brierleyi TaxID=41673 RepID=A0A2U9IEA1_9CREN|nr:hydroxymethylbilane synthase [Acidianus brierleyi]AWR94335.1 hydroxymethylbilane synthase [Acidianus brierleyi]